ncbi:MAG: beta/gamma crystallin family protein [Proteobacteria bacterium]|nr:beta/gamma crystallin family protein [Pseudomonadota bacterium]
MLFDNTDAYAVAHCRKQDHAAGRYGDIAVIQHNRKNGATCFYQALGNLSGDVKAPSKGRSAYSDWETPAGTASIGCAGCHDNGPLIRSPYLTQLTGSNKLPGAGDTSFNRDQPYRFVGNDFASWQVLKVEVAGNLCNSCHRMGFNNVRTHQGTALDLGLRATATSEVAKNPHSTDSPIWMLPSSTYYSQTNEDAAKAIAACATAYRNNQTLPSGCKVTDYTTVGAGCVRLYDECDYGGEFYEACGDHAGLSGQGFNDKTSSLRLGADVERVVLYQHGNYTGSSVTVTEDESCLSQLNNETTSVDVVPPVAADCVRLYDECDYGGEFYDACGDHAGLSGQGFNDKTSSLKLGANVVRAVLYQHGNYTGSSVTVTEDESCLSRLNNETTSVDLTP